MAMEYYLEKSIKLLEDIESIYEVNKVNDDTMDIHHKSGFIRIKGFFSTEISDGWVTIVTKSLSWTYWNDSGKTHITMHGDKDESE